MRKWRTWVLVCVAALLYAGGAPAATELAVTIDDLPTHGPVPGRLSRLEIAKRLVDTLKSHDVPGVYGFLNGRQLHEHPDLEPIVRTWRAAGFLFGNHTFSHADLTRVSAAEYIADIGRNEQFVMRLSPPGARRFFRYSYLHEGDTLDKRNAVRQWLASHGYTIAQVTVDFQDWAWNGAYARCVAREDQPAIARMKHMFVEAARASLAWSREVSTRLFGRQIKHILLLHIGAFDALMINDLLQVYRAEGVRLVGLDTAVRDPVYTIDPGRVGTGELTFLHQIAEARQVPIPTVSSNVSALDRLCR